MIMRYAMISMMAALVLMAGMPAWLLPYESESYTQQEIHEPILIADEPVTDTKPGLTDPVSTQTLEPDPVDAPNADTKTTLRILHTDTGEIEEMDLDTYLYGVVFGEMPASFGLESLKAQAVAARTYTLYQIQTGGGHLGADLCDDSRCCQNYIAREEAVAAWGESVVEDAWELVRQAVDSTSGEVLEYNGELIAALYHASSYGKTEEACYVWGGDVIYLQSVDSPDEDITESVTVDLQTLQTALEQGGYTVNGDPCEWVGETVLTPSGRVKSVKICGQEVPGVWLRGALGLKSAMFDITYDGTSFVFTTHGSGHGVGMSQYGARAYALKGWSYREILEHYYSGAVVVSSRNG